MLILGTDMVAEDEPCISVKEVIQATPDYQARHRYQIIRVLRGERIYELRRDLGDASLFKGLEVFIPGCGADNIPVHRVGELLEIAEYFRGEKPQPPDEIPYDLLEGYYEVREKQLKGVVL